MKKRILFTGLLLLLTLGTFAVTPVAPDKTLCSGSIPPGRLAGLSGELHPCHRIDYPHGS